MIQDEKAVDQSAFEMLRTWPDKMVVWLTSDGYPTINGRIAFENPLNPKRVIVFVGEYSWFEFTEQSDIEIESTGRIHVH